MKNYSPLINKTTSVAVFVITLFTVTKAIPYANALPENQRPISDFVDAQGASSLGGFQIVPPIENFLGFDDPSQDLSISVDYAGLADDYLGGMLDTTFKGNIIEAELSDGRAEVTVNLHTDNALVWVKQGSFFGDAGKPCEDLDDLLFGVCATAVLRGVEPTLGKSLLRVVFTNTAPNAPLPDLIKILAGEAEEGQELIFISVTASAGGTFIDGSPGRVKVIEQGFIVPPGKSQGKALEDGFPVEKIILRETGKKR
jgi:hypothetical protein